MINIIKCELYKLYKTKRFFIGIILALVSILFSILNEIILTNDILTKSSGALIPIYSFGNVSPFFIPMIIIVSASILFSNEYSNGSLKLLLTKPFKRWKIVIGKFISIILVIIFTLIILILVGYICGYFIFEFNSTIYIKEIALSFNEVLKATILSYLFSIIPYMAFTSFVIMICIIFTQPSTSSIINILSLIISSLLGSIMRDNSLFLITSYFNIFTLLTEKNTNNILFGLGLNFIYIIFFLLITIFIFNKRDFKL